MARTKYKCICFFYVLLSNFYLTKSHPIKLPSSLVSTDSVYTNHVAIDKKLEESGIIGTKNDTNIVSTNYTANFTKNFQNDITEPLALESFRPGQTIDHYALTITRNGNGFVGRATIDVRLTLGTMEDPIIFNMEDVNIQNVLVGILTSANAVPAQFNYGDGILEISPPQSATSYSIIIEYSAPFRNDGTGLHLGQYDNNDYIAMNLYPTHARRVFPCIDDPSVMSEIVFTFENMGYNNLFTNTILVDNSETTFTTFNGPNHLWGLVAHNFNNIINIPLQNVHLYARQVLSSNQEAQAMVAINNYYTALTEWTGKPYLEIISNQNGRMNIIAVPDISREWFALSTVCIWEPYILMEREHSVKQRQIAFVKIAQAMASQWFGFVRFPENWRHQWVLSGLSSYAAYDVATEFQTNPQDDSMIDMNTIFTMNVIRESLLIDGYSNSLPLNTDEDIFDENIIRMNIYGLSKIKAPAILRMLRLIVADDQQDIVQDAARALMTSRSLLTLSTQNFYDALISVFNGNDVVSDVDGFLNMWVTNNGYPAVNVIMRSNRITLTQERFSFTSSNSLNYPIPISFTTSLNPNFNAIHPTRLLEEGDTIFTNLGDEDWIIVNIQGQGYYRVNYEEALWGRLIDTLQDPEARNIIHPLNRATLIDDALNLARAGSLNYDIAFSLVLTMEHETEYAVWKAFVRNMDFLIKYLMFYVDDNDLERNIYQRLLHRTIHAFEEDIGFTPNPTDVEPAMKSLTRGLVMEHACRSGYEPCVTAALDWFYDPNNDFVVNPNIPPELRPAIYCTAIREGDENSRQALLNRLDIEASSYERVVILESLACSEDEDFILTLLDNTVRGNSPYLLEERSRLFLAIASSSFEKADIAVSYIIANTNAIRNSYGGPEKLEEVIIGLRDNIVSTSMFDKFHNWVSARNAVSNLEDSDNLAIMIRNQANDNLLWCDQHMEDIYNWLDENDAPTLFVSGILVCLSIIVTLLNT